MSENHVYSISMRIGAPLKGEFPKSSTAFLFYQDLL